MNNYYYVLGLADFSKLEEVKTAYKKLAKKFHPDLNQGDLLFEEKFKQIQEAYEVLSDVQRKNNYDAQLRSFGSSISTLKPTPQLNSKFNLIMLLRQLVSYFLVICVSFILNDNDLLEWIITLLILIWMTYRMKGLGKIILLNESITFYSFLVVRSGTFSYEKLDGFTTDSRLYKIGNKEELQLIKDGKAIKTISSAYYKNYNEMKEYISNKLKFLGHDSNFKVA